MGPLGPRPEATSRALGPPPLMGSLEASGRRPTLGPTSNGVTWAHSCRQATIPDLQGILGHEALEPWSPGPGPMAPWDHGTMAPGGHIKANLEPNWDPFGIDLEPIWNRLGDDLKSIWNEFGTGLGPIWRRFDVILGPIWGKLNTYVGSILFWQVDYVS